MKKMNLRITVLLSVSLLVAGCAKLSHLQELLTLKAYSDETAAQGKYIKAQDAKFEKMVAAAKDGSLNDYTSGRRLRAAFGDPVYTRPSTKDGIVCEEWLYRYAKDYFDSEKIYFYFTENGKLLRWEYVPRKKKEGHGDVETISKNNCADHCAAAQ